MAISGKRESPLEQNHVHVEISIVRIMSDRLFKNVMQVPGQGNVRQKAGVFEALTRAERAREFSLLLANGQKLLNRMVVLSDSES